ncbi:MAG: choice-of-anchor D domain-containing protein [gamma proteobacterium endosymbiont of Lamellibrachia anaximandri]|nr:choice-of-anchor D domain-containing protein [gamma proteobacterium endosymbiont of Lamellibrachia anaximandri]MBL3535689.1 choice-of-anchor D domain-containing protein [gamma proteobacterium endosymbiont of Lamellibrachia anaximandri]
MNNKWLPVFSLAIAILILPFTVNADFADEVKISAFDGANGDDFGNSVSIDGDTAVVGAYDDDSRAGSAYVYVRNPVTGAWNFQQKLTAPDRQDFDRFGSSVSLSGDTVVIGVERDDDNGDESGSAYIFVRDGTGTWNIEQKLLASDGALGDHFGSNVSLSGNTAIIGAHLNGSGAVYVFVRIGTVWSEPQVLLPSTGSVAFNSFGTSVFIEGDRAIIGASGEDITAIDSGAAYIFVRDGGGTWNLDQKLLANDGANGDAFGVSVSINGDTAIVGAMLDDDKGSASGSAYVFVRDGTGDWIEQPKLLASDGTGFDHFGQSVVLTGDTAVVGADRVETAYVFVRDPDTGAWTEDQIVKASVVAGGYAICMSISGNALIIGAPTAVGQGLAFILTSSVATPDITVTDSIAPNADLTVAFGDVTEMTTADQTVTVTNDGNADLLLGNIAQADPLASPFSILNDTCSTQTLTPATSCTLTVRFSPPSTGAFSDSFDIPSDDPDENPVTVNVDGTGIGLAVPDITVTDSVAPVDDLAIAFGNVTQATTSDETVTITNDGNADLTIGNIGALDVLVAPFSILNDTCSTQILAPAASCTLTIRFEPTVVGALGDSFDIPSDDADEATVTVNLTGTGTVALVPDITVTDSVAPADDLQVSFGNVIEGVASNNIVTITNDGTADLILGQIAQANPLAAPFSIQNDTCSTQTLAPAASCTLTVRFSPTVIGIFNGSFDIPSDDADEATVTVNLTGTGTVALVPDITVTDSVAPAGDLQVPFGNVIEGVSSDQIVTITNDGTADLTLIQIALGNPLAAPFSIQNDTCSTQTLAPAASCTLTVRFSPTVIGIFNDSFDIPSDDPDEGSVTVNLSATGVVAGDDDGGLGSIGLFELLFGLLGLVLVFVARNGERSEKA